MGTTPYLGVLTQPPLAGLSKASNFAGFGFNLGIVFDFPDLLLLFGLERFFRHLLLILVALIFIDFPLGFHCPYFPLAVPSFSDGCPSLSLLFHWFSGMSFLLHWFPFAFHCFPSL